MSERSSSLVLLGWNDVEMELKSMYVEQSDRVGSHLHRTNDEIKRIKADSKLGKEEMKRLNAEIKRIKADSKRLKSIIVEEKLRKEEMKRLNAESKCLKQEYKHFTSIEEDLKSIRKLWRKESKKILQSIDEASASLEKQQQLFDELMNLAKQNKNKIFKLSKQIPDPPVEESDE